MSDLVPVLAAAFATGLLGSTHCLGMCAGLSGLFAAGTTVATLKSNVPLALAYNSGRVLSYAFLGVIVAVIGAGAVATVPKLAAPIRIASGALIILIGLQLAFRWRLLSAIEKIGALIWNRVAPRARGFIPADTLMKAAGLGLLWGWLPCGLVYSALLLAATTADAVGGGLVMIAFGLGTMPAMILSGLGASRLSAFTSRNRLAAGLLIVLLGIATLAMPLLNIDGGAHTSSHLPHH